MSNRRLKVALVSGPMYDALYDRIPLFEKRTGYTVEVGTKLIHPELNDHIAECYNKGEGDYDLIVTHNKYAPSQKKWLLPLNEHLGKEEIATFLPSTIDLATIDGDLMGLPRNIDVRLLYYRRDWIEDPDNQKRYKAEFGEYLRVPATWEEFGRVARVMASPPDRFGTLFPGRFSGLFGTWYELMAMAGGQLVDEHDAPVFNSNAGTWALGFLRDLHTTWRATPPNLPELYYDDVAEYFCSGRVAMVTDWPGGYHRYCNPETSQMADRFDVSIYPTGPADICRAYAGIFMFAIPVSARDLPAALELLRFLTDEQSQYEEARQGALAVRSAVHARIVSEVAPDSRDARRLQYLGETAQNCMLEVPKTPWYPHMEDTLWHAVQSAVTGERSVDEALALAASQVYEIVHHSTSL